MTEGNHMMRVIAGIGWLMAVAAAACAVEPPGGAVGTEDTSEVAQEINDCPGCPCPGCGGNGLAQAEWNYVFGTLDQAALGAASNNLWDNASDSPKSLCLAGSVVGPTCTARNAWQVWMGGAPSVQRKGVFRHLVKIVMPRGHYIDLGGERYTGQFGLMPWAREAPWGAAGREIASAGLLALLSAIPGVPVCLNSEEKPDNCVGNSDMRYSESVTFGDAIYGSRYVGIWGGRDAPFPARNRRYGTVSPESAGVHNNAVNTCVTEGEDNARHPLYCRYSGTTWHHPVHVLTPRPPQTWYYGEPPPYQPTVVWPQPQTL